MVRRLEQGCGRGAPAAVTGRRGPSSTDRDERGGALVDVILFQVAVALVAALLIVTSVMPNVRKARRIERRAVRLERLVRQKALRVAELRREVTALQSDPLYIQRQLRSRTKALMPHRYRIPAPPLPEEGAVATASSGEPEPETRTP